MADPALDDYERSILDNVEEHGWHCVSVFDKKGGRPTFTYSVGFAQTLNAPEFIIVGLDGKLMHSMLWSVFRQIRDGKQVPADNARWEDILEGFECVSKPVHSTNIVPEYLNSAMWFRRRILGREDILPAFQLVWPGARDGLFPWDDGCSDHVQEIQTPLYLPNRTLS